MSKIKVVPKRLRFKIYKDLQTILLTFKAQNIDMSIVGSGLKYLKVDVIINNKPEIFDIYAGFCSHLNTLIWVYLPNLALKFTIYSFPELREYDPKDYINGYWGTHEWRLTIIKEILYKQSKNEKSRKNT